MLKESYWKICELPSSEGGGVGGAGMGAVGRESGESGPGADGRSGGRSKERKSADSKESRKRKEREGDGSGAGGNVIGGGGIGGGGVGEIGAGGSEDGGASGSMEERGDRNVLLDVPFTQRLHTLAVDPSNQEELKEEADAAVTQLRPFDNPDHLRGFLGWTRALTAATERAIQFSRRLNERQYDRDAECVLKEARGASDHL